jgi:hypothetical protein
MLFHLNVSFHASADLSQRSRDNNNLIDNEHVFCCWYRQVTEDNSNLVRCGTMRGCSSVAGNIPKLSNIGQLS